ncbi:MAG TPA: beta-N-acetylhexosaminidase, partial [Gemmatimonadaceae bacterium]|nr:beta-N-acetylhexosaminidase [Gemmatimonadaceae bacterium]
AALFFACVAEITAQPLRGQQTLSSDAIIPRPASLTSRAGHFTITPNTAIWTTRETAVLGHQLASYLAPATGFDLNVRAAGTPTGNRILLRLDPKLTRLGDEGYTLDVAPGVVSIRASKPAGIFYGIQSLRQLLPVEIFREAPVIGVAWTIPAVHVEDSPRFAWRGMHLDVVRHFMPKEFVKKFIDLLALHKMNSFHWHLTDDQGWRIEIKKYPRLTEVGAWRKQSLIGHEQSDTTKHVFDGKRHGGFYTQDDIREIVAYAKARYINIVPEIEMPGHAQAAISAYPELGNTGKQIDLREHWGVSQNILNPEDKTVAFMQDVLGEVLTLFPGKFIHVGGDEAVKDEWKASPRVQQRIRELGLKDEHELQSWFIRKMDTYLTQHGRRLIGWDEILEGGLAPNAAVMSWRGTAGGIAAAREGHDVVMAPGGKLYFDHYQSRDTNAEPLAIGGFNPLDSVYAFDPMPAELEPQFAKHILGAQGQLWTEYMPDPKHVEYMAFPRVSALAEGLWSPTNRKDYVDFSRRLQVHLERLGILDVNYRPLDH